MTRRKDRGRRLHGIVLLDKPDGLTSNRALQRVKHLFQASKAGHTGSLDPLATGMLPICFGEATKLAGYLLSANKGYETTARFGITTDSGDADGTVLQRRDLPADLDQAQIETVCQTFLGAQQQVPPMVSAIKVDGQRLYRLAREGKSVEREPRPVEIHGLSIVRLDLPDVELVVRCSKGTYIRSLVMDIGEAIACGAHVTALRRQYVEPFEGQPMHPLGELESLAEQGGLQALDTCLLPIDAGLAHLPRVLLDPDGVSRFRQGQLVRSTTSSAGSVHEDVGSMRIWRVYDTEQHLIGLARLNAEGCVAPLRVLQC